MSDAIRDSGQPFLPGLEPPQEPIKRGGFTIDQQPDPMVGVLSLLQKQIHLLENIDKSLEELVVLMEDADEGGYRGR